MGGKDTLTLYPGHLTLPQLRGIQDGPVQLDLCQESVELIRRSSDTVREIIDQGRIIYGINTGFGLLANTVIPNDELEDLQRSIVLSHAAGIGRLMKESTVRLMMVLKINGGRFLWPW